VIVTGPDDRARIASPRPAGQAVTVCPSPQPPAGAAPGGPWLLEPAAPAVPVVACLPHGGREYPQDLRADLAVSPDILWSDWRTRELYAFLPSLGITTITTSYSRFVADVNRDPAGERHGKFWSSVVYAQTPNGRALYRRALSPAQVAHRIRLAHEPFHRALDAAVGGLLAQFPRLLVLDLHSFGVPLDADVILGDRHGQTARPDTVRLLSDAFTRHGFTVQLNERFSGGWTVRRFAGHDRVDAVQVELNQRRYLNFAGHTYPDPPPTGDFEATQRWLHTLLAEDVVASPAWRSPR
jgi:N-formylglutamate deformylase